MKIYWTAIHVPSTTMVVELVALAMLYPVGPVAVAVH